MSSCTPTRICFTVMDGFHDFSSFRMLRHTLPLGRGLHSSTSQLNLSHV